MTDEQKIPDKNPEDRIQKLDPVGSDMPTDNDDRPPSKHEQQKKAQIQHEPPAAAKGLPQAQQTETSNMETHAHHLHKAPGHGWKHYFFEFLMLFLAVSLGFLAENQRENYVERHREKQFAHLLYADFKKDTKALDEIIDVKKWRAQKIDSLFYFLSLPDLQKNAKPIYYYGAFVAINVWFRPNDATIQQLRSSGSLRYFKNPALYNSITRYYSDCGYYYDIEPTITWLTSSGEKAKIFETDKFFSFQSITPSIKDAVRYPDADMQLVTTDKSIINEFKLYSRQAQLSNDLTVLLLSRIRQQLDELINDLEKEYHLE